MAVVNATPADYGFPVPSPQPTLPADTDPFNPPLLGSSSGPAVGEWMRTGGPDDTIALAGPNFISSTQFHFFAQTTSGAAEFDRAVNDADSVGASVILPSTLPAWSTYLLWPNNGGTYGKPVAVNRTDAWWLGSDKAVSGDTVSVYGRNLAHDNGTSASYVYITPANAAGQYVTVTSVNPYRVSFTVPSFAAGTSQVWVHNGHGGHFGWSGPLSLTVLSASPFAGQSANLYNVKNYGATGNGSTDDTAAIKNALNAAAAHAPATLYFPAGSYIVNGELDSANNVSWLGDGRDSSYIKAGSGFYGSSGSAFITGSANNVEFKNLTIDGNGNLGPGHNNGKALIDLRGNENIRFTSVTLNYKQKAFSNGDGYGSSNLGLEGNSYLSITNSTLIGAGIFFGATDHVSIDGSTFRLTDRANSTITSWGGHEFSVTNTTVQDYDITTGNTADAGERFFVAQGHFGPLRNFYFGDNTTINLAPPLSDPDQNAGEQILYELGGTDVFGTVTSATRTSVTFSISATSAAGADAIIIKGRGVGQVRRIVSASGSTITLSPAWNVAPDKTSRIVYGSTMTHSVVYHNTLDGKSDWNTQETASRGVEMFGNVYENIVANNTITDVRRGVGTWALSTGGVAPAFFNLVVGNRVTNAFDGFYNRSPDYGAPAQLGSFGHIGNTYRANALSNIMEYPFLMGPREPNGVNSSVSGRDFDHEVIEHNTASNGPQVAQSGIPVDVSTGFYASHADTNLRLLNTVIYKNSFDRGTGPLSGSTAFSVPRNSVTTFFRTGNQWFNFQHTTTDPDTAPPSRELNGRNDRPDGHRSPPPPRAP